MNKKTITPQMSLEYISLKFKSGNEIPVKRASITLEEWNYFKDQLEKRLHLSFITAAFGFLLGVIIPFLVILVRNI